MNDSICNFIPPKAVDSALRTVHFVYETEFHKMKQPFVTALHYMHIVTGGEAVIRDGVQTHTLRFGSVFFFFPGIFYEIEASPDFRYMYISFTGSGVASMLEEQSVTVHQWVFHGFEEHVDFWFSAITRTTAQNAALLSESVLYYTLSFFTHIGIHEGHEEGERAHGETLCMMMVDYIEAHYADKDLSLQKIARIFSYTEKYLSVLFKKQMRIGFRQYLNTCRMRHAKRILAQNPNETVLAVAAACGYRDALYFSKVFKKHTGCSPSEYTDPNGK